MFSSPRGFVALLVAVLLAVAAVGCGGSSDAEPSAREAPEAAEFPQAEGDSIEDLLAEVNSSDLVVTPVGQVFREGENRYGFAVFELDRTQVLDADVALYFQHESGGPVQGPLPARVESLETRPAFAAMTTYQDDDAAKAVYVVDGIQFDQPGGWNGIALIRTPDGLEAGRVPSPVVRGHPDVPDIGDRAPMMNTPTAESVGGDLTKIDTRVPPTNMHTDLAEVLGRKPVVLVFATPQLCQSRVCGPVVDVQAQVEAEMGDMAEFIHMEIFNDNDPNQGVRPQVRRYGLPTEPWLFVMDAEGVITERIEGAFGLEELRKAVREAAGRGRAAAS